MANLLQSCQSVATQAPSYYTNYLSNLASKGAGAACMAHFVGASPLQTSAFGSACAATGAYQPQLQTSTGALNQATQMAAHCTPASAASPYLHGATSCLAQRTQTLMNPYVSCVVRQIGTLGEQNIQQNLAPGATAAAVGSGQFGSQRGAQVLGQTLSNADQQILAQQAQALQCGFKTAMCGALRQGALCVQAGSTAGCLAGKSALNLGTLAKTGACLAVTCQSAALNRLNALNTLGAACRAIAQCQQLYPLSVLCKESALLRGYQIPTTQRTTATTSGLGALASLGATTAGLLCSKNGASVACSLLNLGRNVFGNSGGGATCFANAGSWCAATCALSGCASGLSGYTFARGGPVGALCLTRGGCASLRHRGALAQQGD